MIRHFTITSIVLLFFTTNCTDAQNETNDGSSWQKEFNLADRNLVPTGKNVFFILEPGFQLVLEGYIGKNKKSFEKLIITVLEETKEVDGVITRVVEEREWKDNDLYEVSRNFYAIDSETKDVFYFGEEVKFYENDRVINNNGEWLAGIDDAEAGLIMPGKPELGMMYYQEVAPGVAMDRAEVVSLSTELETPADTFSDCLKTKEGTALNLKEKEYKTYAAGIGLIQDQSLLLKSYGFIEN